MNVTILTLPGLYNSTEGHWQTVWEQTLPNARRVQQRDWDRPDRQEWVATLDAALAAEKGPVLLAAHSLGCALVAWWCATGNVAQLGHRVKGALLVAPPDVERGDVPDGVASFAPMPRARLPFPAVVAASSDDPWCAPEKAMDWARDWGAQWQDVGPRGHINAASAMGEWPQAQDWLRKLAAAA